MRSLLVKIVFILLFVLSVPLALLAQMDPDEYKAQWIVINIAPRTTWPNENQIDTFYIGVYGRSTQVYNYLNKLSKRRRIKNKPFKVFSYARLNQIEFNKIHLLYVENNRNDLLSAVFDRINYRPILLVTYRAENKEKIMINLLLRNQQEQFEINSFNIKQAGLKVDEALLKLGGTKVDIRGLLEKKEKELLLKEQMLNRQKDSLQKQRLILKQKEKELEQLRKQLERQRKELQLKEQQLLLERKRSQQLSENIQKQKDTLQKNRQILAELNKQIAEKQKIIENQIKEIKEREKQIKLKEQELKQQAEQIEKQRKILARQNILIENQRTIIYSLIFISLLFSIMLAIILISYRKIRKLNKLLQEKNKQIEQQKNELQLQAKQLEEFNKELEKLSLVASRTDNSVIIMDKDGNFEWVNPGFTRLYGYTLQLLKNELGGNLKEVSGNPKIEELIDYVIKNKTTVTYEARNLTRNGKTIWVQTSLTPILNEHDEVVKLFAIETDITKLKEQEKQIRQINEELRRQRDMLIEQKEQIEFQNQLIKDSIRYAQTIQQAILPRIEEIQKYFDVFIVYLPRDIVSGDFYWFAKTAPHTYFAAVVDCTGHGVPGAFMSLIASRMLSEIILEKQIHDPKQILETLNQNVIEALNQRHTDNDDGMDVCLVRIDEDIVEKQYKITFSGAKRPLFYYKRSEGEVKMLKGDRKSVGGKRAMKSPIQFTNKELTLTTNDIIYLTTDGMIDQNNPKRRRFGTPRFLDLLNEIKDFDLEKQQDYIIKTLKDFMKNQPQRDDITIMGLKFR